MLKDFTFLYVSPEEVVQFAFLFERERERHIVVLVPCFHPWLNIFRIFLFSFPSFHFWRNRSWNFYIQLSSREQDEILFQRNCYLQLFINY